MGGFDDVMGLTRCGMSVDMSTLGSQSWWNYDEPPQNGESKPNEAPEYCETHQPQMLPDRMHRQQPQMQMQMLPDRMHRQQPQMQHPHDGAPINADRTGQVRLTARHGEIEVDWTTLVTVLFRMFGTDRAQPQNMMSHPIPQPTLMPMRAQPQIQHENAPAMLNTMEPAVKKAKRNGKAGASGYKWRKYGQKLLTFSQRYREYFKCTYPGCNAKKHVEVIPETGQIIGSSSTPHTHP